MRRFSRVIALPVLISACQDPAVQVRAAAPPDALACAFRVADENGYKPASDSSGRLTRVLFGREGDPIVAGAGKDAQLTDYLTISVDGESLRFIAVGALLGGEAVRPSPRTIGHIDYIIAACGAKR